MANINIMPLGTEVLGWTPEPEKYHNDNIHPCVRFIPGGFAGHEWWMVTTPYFESDDSIENPILYWGDSEPDGTPPLEWYGGVVVEDTPSTGFNSDGYIYFDGNGLWVFWKEAFTPDSGPGLSNVSIFGRYTTNGSTFTAKKLFAQNSFSAPGKTGNNTVCPIVVDIEGSLKLYTSYNENAPISRSYGLGLWNLGGTLNDSTFTFSKKIGLRYKSGFNFWHFDIFEHLDKYYCIVTPDTGTEILLGVSDDAENFKFWNTPLLSTSVTGGHYFYKPTAMVHQGVLYVWHPNKIEGRSRIFMSHKNFNSVISDLENTVSLLTIQ